MTKLSTRAAIEKVMTGTRKSVTVAAIFEAAFPLTALAGQTPKQTFYGVLYGEAKKADGLVVRVDKGTFRLNPRRRKVAALTTLEQQARESFAADVRVVAATLAQSTTVAEFVDALRELIEVASDWRVLVADSDWRVLVADSGDEDLEVRVARAEFVVSAARRRSRRPR